MNAQGSPSPGRAAGKIACRAIELSDIPAIIDLLMEGFPERDRAYWVRGFERFGCRPAVGAFPRYGYLLDADGTIVGCLLLIVSLDERGLPRANISSWYVHPAYRSVGSMLVSRAFRHKELTIVNISPAPHTIPIIDAQGYRRYVSGQVVAAPALSLAGIGARVIGVRPGVTDRTLLPEREMALLERHASCGCLCFVCETKDGREPFVFVRGRPMRGIVPVAQLLWSRDVASVARFAGAIGRRLLGHGIPIISVDAAGPITGLPGAYREGRAFRYYRGPNRPRIGDLADTELAVFGV